MTYEIHQQRKILSDVNIGQLWTTERKTVHGEGADFVSSDLLPLELYLSLANLLGSQSVLAQAWPKLQATPSFYWMED